MRSTAASRRETVRGLADRTGAEGGDDVGDDVRRRGLIGGDADGVGVDGAQVDALGLGGGDDLGGLARHARP